MVPFDGEFDGNVLPTLAWNLTDGGSGTFDLLRGFQSFQLQIVPLFCME